MIYSAELFFKNETGDFPGGPVIKTSSNAGGADLIPGQRTKFPHTSLPKKQNIKQQQYCNRFSKDFKNVHIKRKKKFLRVRELKTFVGKQKMSLGIHFQWTLIIRNDRTSSLSGRKILYTRYLDLHEEKKYQRRNK